MEVDRFVVTIGKGGEFPREKLEQMKWLWNLKDSCRRATLCCTWINRNVNAIIKGKVYPAFLYMAERRRNESVCCLYRGLKEQCNGCDPFTQPGHDTS